MSAKKTRSYEKTFEVAAPVESVWKAITDGNEMMSWFCQEATCEPIVYSLFPQKTDTPASACAVDATA